jgi:iron complex outermembrane receptor protein
MGRRKLTAGLAAVYVAGVVLGFCSPARAQQEREHELEPVVVTATRIPSGLSAASRSVVVLDRDDIDRAPVHSVPDLLGAICGLDLRRRGPFGIQAEASIRGSSHEQTLVLVDGIKVTDPQTGHHNLDLPLTLHDVERVEVLKGHGSRLYGPNAVGGVINIITTTERREATLSAAGGEYGYADGSLSISYPFGTSRHHLSLSKARSDGYREDTDFDTSTVFYRTGLAMESREISFTFGQTKKEFGADSFYSNLFPNEWEETKTRFVSSQGMVANDFISVSSKLFWRRHEDDFLLDRSRPAWFRNQHSTDAYGLELQSTIAETGWGSFAFGGELLHDSIESTNLGDHSRNSGGLFLEYSLQTERLGLVPGLNIHRYANWGWRIWPGIDVSYRLAEDIRLYGSVGRSFRIPSYTELYYTSPANKGNPELHIEKAWSYEAGLSFRFRPGLRGTVSVFARRGRDLIDWVRPESTDPWEAENISSVDTYGLEAGLTISPQVRRFLSQMHVSYAFLDSDKEIGTLQSKYVLDYLRHQLILGVMHEFPWQIQGNWTLHWKDRTNEESYVFMDVKIRKSYRWVEFFLQATNLLNTGYSEVGGVPMPGRWITAGVRLDLISGR